MLNDHDRCLKIRELGRVGSRTGRGTKGYSRTLVLVGLSEDLW